MYFIYTIMFSFLSESQLKKSKDISSFQIIKVLIPANNASITPPLGPLLGQYGISINEFCKEFNEETKFIEKDTIVCTKIFLASNKSYYFELCTLSVSYLIKKFMESDEKDDLIYTKEEFLKIAYIITFFKLNIFNDNINLIISEKLFKNYLNSVIGTMRSFGLTINE